MYHINTRTSKSALVRRAWYEVLLDCLMQQQEAEFVRALLELPVREATITAHRTSCDTRYSCLGLRWDHHINIASLVIMGVIVSAPRAQART